MFEYFKKGEPHLDARLLEKDNGILNYVALCQVQDYICLSSDSDGGYRYFYIASSDYWVRVLIEM